MDKLANKLFITGFLMIAALLFGGVFSIVNAYTAIFKSMMEPSVNHISWLTIALKDNFTIIAGAGLSMMTTGLLLRKKVRG